MPIALALTTALLARGDHVIAAAREPASGGLSGLAKAHPALLTPLTLDVTSEASVAAAKAALAGGPSMSSSTGIYGPRDRQSALDMDSMRGAKCSR